MADADADVTVLAIAAGNQLFCRPRIQGQNSQATATRSAPAWGRIAARWRADPATGLDGESWRGLTLTAGFDRLGGERRSRQLGLAWRLPI